MENDKKSNKVKVNSKKLALSVKDKNLIKQSNLLVEYGNNGYNMSAAAKKLGIPLSTVDTWKIRDKVFNEMLERFKEQKLDEIEQALHEVSVKEKNVQGLIFLAKTLGRKRGYGEQVDVKHSGNIGIIPITINIPKGLTDENGDNIQSF